MGADAEGEAHEDEHEGRHGQRESLVELDAVGGAICPLASRSWVVVTSRPSDISFSGFSSLDPVESGDSIGKVMS